MNDRWLSIELQSMLRILDVIYQEWGRSKVTNQNWLAQEQAKLRLEYISESNCLNSTKKEFSELVQGLQSPEDLT